MIVFRDDNTIPDESYLVIHYFAMLGKRKEPNHVAALPSIWHNLFERFIRLPHNLAHYLYGYKYFQRGLISGNQSGIHVDFIYNDAIDDEAMIRELTIGLNVFFICTDNNEELIEMNISLSRLCGKNCLFWVDDSAKGIFIMPNIIYREEEFWAYLFDYVQPFLPYCDEPLSVPIDAGHFDYPFYRPANITFLTLSSSLGNWGIGTIAEENMDFYIYFKIANELYVEGNHSWKIQDKMIGLVEQQYSWCFKMFNIASDQGFSISDQFLPPLLMAAPYTTKDMRDDIKIIARSEKGMKSMAKVIELDETSNYNFDIFDEESYSESNISFSLICMLHLSRTIFIDTIAGLHCSFLFSPYLRLPLISKSINKELSYVGVKNNSHLAYSKDRRTYDKTIHKIGKILGEKLLAPQTIKLLNSVPTQIVAMTDLPIEWMEINEIPIAFTHDVCRIPVTPSAELINRYESARFAALYTIPEDILLKTLVVYGCREDAFVKMQEKADIVAQEVGAKTAVCLSLDEFDAAVKKYNPDFLIIDTHGGTDLDIRQSYIMMGNDTVFPDDIAKRKLCARLVFISACNTAPCYNDVNKIANAFLFVGASSVTSSYLPLNVEDSSSLYINILKKLSKAAGTGIHRNWLAFISNALRTSFVETSLSDSSYFSPPFEDRPSIYEHLKNNEMINGKIYDNAIIIPHYLMYNTLGRADLIMFESAKKMREELFNKIFRTQEG